MHTLLTFAECRTGNILRSHVSKVFTGKQITCKTTFWLQAMKKQSWLCLKILGRSVQLKHLYSQKTMPVLEILEVPRALGITMCTKHWVIKEFEMWSLGGREAQVGSPIKLRYVCPAHRIFNPADPMKVETNENWYPIKKPKPEKCTVFKGQNINLIIAMHKPSLNHFPNTQSDSSVLTDNFFLL